MDEYGECPRCGSGLSRTPALSRYDNKTYVCPNCGMLEGMWVMQHPGETCPPLNVLLTMAPQSP